MTDSTSPETSSPNLAKKIIFFDGVCHLCNSFVDFVIQHDPKRQFMFAPLQGETARKLLGARARENLNSVIYFEDEKVFDQSQAVLRIFKKLPAPYNFLSRAGQILPNSARDLLYQLIAKNRYKWFGKKESCRIPTAQERNQFLD